MRRLYGVGEFLEACHVAGELAGGVVGAELVGGRAEEGAPERCGAHHGGVLARLCGQKVRVFRQRRETFSLFAGACSSVMRAFATCHTTRRNGWCAMACALGAGPRLGFV